MGLHNAKYYTPGMFFWDERAATLEDQILMPIQDSIEMGMTLPDLIIRLKALPYYPVLFNDAFGSSEITFFFTSISLCDVSLKRSFQPTELFRNDISWLCNRNP